MAKAAATATAWENFVTVKRELTDVESWVHGQGRDIARLNDEGADSKGDCEGDRPLQCLIPALITLEPTNYSLHKALSLLASIQIGLASRFLVHSSKFSQSIVLAIVS
jgi:hypothetical protein